MNNHRSRGHFGGNVQTQPQWIAACPSRSTRRILTISDRLYGSSVRMAAELGAEARKDKLI
jgi:hypothetical protein